MIPIIIKDENGKVLQLGDTVQMISDETDEPMGEDKIIRLVTREDCYYIGAYDIGVDPDSSMAPFIPMGGKYQYPFIIKKSV